MLISVLLSAYLTPFVAAGTTSSDARKDFRHLLEIHSNSVWAKRLDARTKASIRDYEARVTLPNGLVYGESVRGYSLEGKCPAAIEKDLLRLGCTKKIDVIREPKHNEPIVDRTGRTNEIQQFICKDGGVFKIKPSGDPTNRYVPFPHGSRTLRYPWNAEYRDYRDEVAKISEEGHVIPRGPGDLGPKELARGWSREAHVPLCAAPETIRRSPPSTAP